MVLSTAPTTTPKSMSKASKQARAFIERIISCNVEENELSPDDETWGPILRELNEHTYQEILIESKSRLKAGNAAGKYLKLLEKSDPGLRLLMRTPVDEVEQTGFRLHVPPLKDSKPDYKKYDIAQARCWLDQYVAWSKYWVPEAPEDWHELGALFAIGALVERRVLITDFDDDIVPSVYLLLLAESGTGKSRIANKAQQLVEAATGIGKQLISTDAVTAQKMTADADPTVPADWEQLSLDEREEVLRRYAHAPFRSMFWDEFGPKLAQMSAPNATSAMSGLLNILLTWYAGWGEGQKTVTSVNSSAGPRYLCFMGGGTPSTFKKIGKNTELITSGLFPRFAVSYQQVTKGTLPRIGKSYVPEELWQPMRQLHENLGRHEVNIVPVSQTEDQKTKKHKQRYRLERAPFKELRLSVAKNAEVAEALQIYMEEMSNLSYSDLIPAELGACYRRFGERVLRFAGLIALSECGSNYEWCCDPGIEMRHLVAAIQIVERLRISIHACYEALFNGETTMQRAQEDRVVDVMKRFQGTWVSLSDLKNRYLTTLDNETLRKILTMLEAEHELVICERPNKRRHGTLRLYSLPGTLPPEDATMYSEWASEEEEE